MSDPVAIEHQPSRRARSSTQDVASSGNRDLHNARLTSPVPSPHRRPLESNGGLDADPSGHLTARRGSLPGGQSIHPNQSPTRHGQLHQPPTDMSQPQSNYGSFQASPMQANSPRPYEDFDVVRRHLALPVSKSGDGSEPNRSSEGIQSQRNDTDYNSPTTPAWDDELNASLRLQSGDITREIYRRTAAEEAARKQKLQRSQSFSTPRSEPADEELDIENIRKPGGFRRDHLRRNAPSPHPEPGPGRGSGPAQQQPSILTRNFYEFLSLYGHFAGEPFDEDQTSDQEIPYDSTHRGRLPANIYVPSDGDEAEDTPLLRRRRTKGRGKDDAHLKKGATGTALILLKSFVGTGVLFLPRAFLNGGMLFSSLVMLAVASLSYYCFLLLTTSRLKLKGSYADMGQIAYGRLLRTLINSSLVVSQVGFASAYIVFTSENLQAFILAVSKCRTFIDIKLMILMQLAVFLPLSLYRNLNNISVVVYVADLFIVLGLVYLYYFGIATIFSQGGAADIENFNSKTWTLFIGTVSDIPHAQILIERALADHWDV